MVHMLPPALLLVLAVLTLPISSRRSPMRHNHEEDDSFNEILQEEEDKVMVMLHNQRVSEASACDVPKVQVIHVSDHYPGKYYFPHCTLLHRCGKHAGCCAVETLKCVAAEKERVTLHFYSVKFDGDDLMERKIEKLVFTNHTRCACAVADEAHKYTSSERHT